MTSLNLPGRCVKERDFLVTDIEFQTALASIITDMAVWESRLTDLGVPFMGKVVLISHLKLRIRVMLSRRID